jgi:small subunit ribosomal protein S9
MKPGNGVLVVDGKPLLEYFTTLRDQMRAKAPLALLPTPDSYDVSVNVQGGGPHGQAGAIQLGIARAMKIANPVLFEQLRALGFLTRDSRMKERKKYGRRGARRGFQFSKR